MDHKVFLHQHIAKYKLLRPLSQNSLILPSLRPTCLEDVVVFRHEVPLEGRRLLLGDGVVAAILEAAHEEVASRVDLSRRSHHQRRKPVVLPTAR